MSRKSTAAYSVFIIVTVCLLFAALLVLPRKQDHSSNTSSDYVQTHENRDDKKANEQPISYAAAEDLFKQNSVQRDSK